MSRFRDKWNSSPIQERVLIVIRLLLSSVAILMCIIGLLRIIDINITNSIAIPILGVITFLNGLSMYKINKAVGIFCFVSAFIFLCCIAILYARFSI